MTTTITEFVTNPPTVIVAGAGTAAVNYLSFGLPLYINIAMSIYLTLMVLHKGWQMYKEYKNESSQQ